MIGDRPSAVNADILGIEMSTHETVDERHGRYSVTNVTCKGISVYSNRLLFVPFLLKEKLYRAKIEIPYHYQTPWSAIPQTFVHEDRVTNMT